MRFVNLSLLGLLYCVGASEEDALDLEMPDFEEPDAMMAGDIANDIKNPFDETSVKYKKLKFKPVDPASYPDSLIVEQFQAADIGSSGWSKLSDSSYNGEWLIQQTDVNYEGDLRLVMNSQKAYHGLAKELNELWTNAEEALYVSLEAKYPENHVCGGAYLKLFDSKGAGVEDFNAKTPYSIMFGPDHCGSMTNKVHLIIQRTEGNQRVEFAFQKTATPSFDRQLSHQYGLVLRKDNTYKVYHDGQVVAESPMIEGCPDCFVSPAEIEDPDDVQPEGWTPPPETLVDETAVKPDDWDETQPEMIPDPDAPVPEGWELDEPLLVPNPNAQKPEDWVDEEDGEWIVPKMKNPKCVVGCGKWEPMKKNPLYKGKWSPPTYPNPDYTPTYKRRMIPHPHPYDYKAAPYSAIEKFNSVGFELWAVESGTVFDNIIVTTSETEFNRFLEETWKVKSELENANKQAYLDARKAHMNAQEKSAETDSSAYDRTKLMMAVAAVLVAGVVYLVVRKIRGPVASASDAKKAETTEEVGTKKKDEVEADSEKTAAETETVEETGAKGGVEETTVTRRRKGSNDKQAVEAE